MIEVIVVDVIAMRWLWLLSSMR